jgi:hypothetical protein
MTTGVAVTMSTTLRARRRKKSKRTKRLAMAKGGGRQLRKMVKVGQKRASEDQGVGCGASVMGHDKTKDKNDSLIKSALSYKVDSHQKSAQAVHRKE